MKQIINVDMRFPLILFVVLLILKLTTLITWGWWEVTSPLWIPIGSTIVVAVLSKKEFILSHKKKEDEEQNTKQIL